MFFQRGFGYFVLVAALLPCIYAAPVGKREVPQEHSHNSIIATVNTSLKTNNPANIEDAIFGLLGNAAGIAGAGSITDATCLQQATADQAFTNAKAAGDVDGQVAALIYRGLERNTGSVGLASAPCTSIKAVNPEIAAISQHQDPASDNAAAINKGITLAIAQQIAAVGGNPQDALKAGTFAPGKIGDPTAKGNTCDVVDDTLGCIFSQNLLVDDATADEINAAVAGISSAASSAAASSSSDASAAAAASPAVVAQCQAQAASQPAAADASGSAPAAAVSSNSALNFGSCSNPTVEFGAGLDGRQATEFSFLPNNLVDFNHGSALNPDIIFQFICDTLVNNCGLNNANSTVITCRAAQKTADGFGKTGAAADSFNGALGFQTDFAALDTPAGAASAAPAAAASAAPAAAASPAPAAAASSSSAAAASSSSQLDFGSCTNPTVEFADGLDGRTQFSFEPADESEFNHGSALAPGVIFSFICGQLQSACKASAATVSACNAAEAAGNALGKTGAAADAFNAALGFQTDFASLDAQAAATSK